MSGDELIAAGCRRWDESLVLFPGVWFDEIPEGFEVTTLTGDRRPFARDMSRDTRIGLLPFGVLA